MANTIRIKRRITGASGAPASLANAELCFNEVDSTLYYGKGGDGTAAATIVAIAGGGAFASLSGATFTGDVVVGGNFTVNGTTETINATTVQVADKNIELAKVATPTDTTADGGGITVKGATDKSLTWVSSVTSWTSSDNFNLASGKSYKINGTNVLTATALGAGVVGSSLTSVGTLTAGTWNASAVQPAYGGTGLTSVVSGLLKGNGSVYSVAVDGTDFLSPSSTIDGGSY